MVSKGLQLCILLAALFGCAEVLAQTPRTISLAEAQAIALRNHPRIASAVLNAQAGAAAIKEVRSAYFPTVSGNLTGVEAEPDATLTAGTVQTSSLYSRLASGLAASQLITNFGRTSSLEQSAKLHNAAENQTVEQTREQVELNVKLAYFQALAAQSVLGVAKATLDLRQLTLRQVSALAQSALRSTLDVSFASVNVSQAQLALYRAQSNAQASHTRLSAAMGFERDETFTLADEPAPPAPNTDINALITQALHDRPDLAGMRLNHDSLERYAESEKRLRNPTVTLAGVAGVAPERDEKLRETYSAVGINVNIPILNGGLFSARHAEAQAHAQAAGKDEEALEVQVAQDVQVAWLDANDAFQRLDVAAKLVDEANEALRLAQARYSSGLGGIVELNEAQLNQTSAQITAATAKYEYLGKRTVLDYELGAIH